MNRFIKEFSPEQTDVALCGSMKHRKEMIDIVEQLKSKGFSVSSPDLQVELTDYDGMNDQVEIGKTKNFWIRRHFANIANAKVVLVANYDKNGYTGYVGANTLLEMGAGYIYNKKIYILNPISKQPNYEEVLGLEPIMLNGKLENIKVSNEN